MEASTRLETCEIGLYSAMEESVYEVIVEGNESPSSEKSIKAFIKRMVEAIKDFFKKALVRFQAFFHKEKNPLSGVEEYLKKHPEYKNIKVKIPDLKETEKDIEDTGSILSRIKLKLQRGKLDMKDIEEINNKKNGTTKKVILVSLIAAVALVGNSIRKLKKIEKETIKEIEEFATTSPSVFVASDARNNLIHLSNETDKTTGTFRDKDARSVFRRMKKVERSKFDYDLYMETYFSDVGSAVIDINKKHLNCIDRAVGNVLGVWKRLENNITGSFEKGFDMGKDALLFDDKPNKVKRLKEYVDRDSTMELYDKIGYGDSLYFARKFLQ